MECPICFNEKTKFKVLLCSHFFCAKCLSDLALGIAVDVAQGDLKASASPKPLVTDKFDKNVIECPKCRKDTIIPENGGVAGLKSKFIGKLTCRHCDLTKSVEDFRWCHTCLMSVCSTCFIDKHINRLSDGMISFHSASKWEEYSGLLYCLSQMKLQHNKAEVAFKNSKQYIEVYTEGLKEYLTTEIEGKCRSVSETVSEKSQVIAEAYGVDMETIKKADEEELETLEYILAEVCNLAGLDKKTAVLDEVVQLIIQEVPYKEIAKHVLNPKKLEFEPQWPKVNRFRENSKRSLVIGENIIKKPSDICLIYDNRLLIADPEDGLFLFKQNRPLNGPLPLEFKGGFWKICNFPAKMRVNTIVATTFDYEVWKFALIQIDENGEAEQVSIEGSSLWPLPSNQNMSIASSQSHIFALDTASLWSLRNIANPSQWSRIYSSKSYQHQTSLDAVNENGDSADVFLFNTNWGSIDIVTISNADQLVLQVKRVRIPFAHNPNDLFLAPTPEFDTIIIGNDSANKLRLWYPSITGEKFTELCDFPQKYVQKMVISNNAAFMILKLEKGSPISSLEMISL